MKMSGLEWESSERGFGGLELRQVISIDGGPAQIVSSFQLGMPDIRSKLTAVSFLREMGKKPIQWLTFLDADPEKPPQCSPMGWGPAKLKQL